MSARYRRLFQRYMRIYSFALYFGVAIIVVGTIVGILLYDVAGLIVAVGSVTMGTWLAVTAYYVRKHTGRIMKRYLDRSKSQRPPPP